MLEIRSIATRVGKSEHQIRRVLRALAPLLEQRTKRGKDNRILIDSNGLSLVERAVELWSGGIPLSGLYDALTDELGKAPNHQASSHASNAVNPLSNGYTTNNEVPQPTPALLAEKDERINDLKQIIHDLRADKAELKHQLDETHELMKALPSTSASRKRLSLGQRVRALIYGEI